MESRNTLKKIKFQGFHRQLDELPVFYNVEELDFGVTWESFEENALVSAVFPTLLSNECLPKLKKIRLDLGHHSTTRRLIEKYFWGSCDTPLDSVDELELESYCDRDVMEYLAQIFPRVTYVRLNYQNGRYGCENTRRKATDVWYLAAFPRLSKLVVRGFPMKPGSMDSFLTGIPLEIRTKFRTVPKQIISSCCSEMLRPYCSIVKLKNLRELTIILVSGTELEMSSLRDDENPFMSIMSVWYALELIHDLRPNFLYCRRKHRLFHDDIKVLEETVRSVKQYLTIGQCHCAEMEAEFFREQKKLYQ